MQYWKRKNALPGLNYESNNKLPNGLAKSSALQSTEEKGIRNPKASTKKPTPPVPPKKSTASEKSTPPPKPLTPEERMEKKLKEKTRGLGSSKLKSGALPMKKEKDPKAKKSGPKKREDKKRVGPINPFEKTREEKLREMIEKGPTPPTPPPGEEEEKKKPKEALSKRILR